MIATIVALAEAAEHTKDYDELLAPIAWSLVGAALIYAIVATWMVTERAGSHH